MARPGTPLTASAAAEPGAIDSANGRVIALDALRCPALIVGGDDVRYHAGCRIIVDEVADAALVVVDGAGHFPHQTHAEVVGDKVREFLSRVSG